MDAVGDVFCHCGCHEPGSTLHHCLPCCQTCDMCGRRVKWGSLQDHKAKHVAEIDALPEGYGEVDNSDVPSGGGTP